jgi:hypothetical protein
VVAGAIGIVFTWRGQRFAREAQEEGQRNTQAQLTNAQEELRLTRQGLHSALSYRSPADYEESTMEGVAVA